MKTILVTCQNPECDREFRVPEYKFNSTIKNNSEKQECNICKNKKLLSQSTLYGKNGKSAKHSYNRATKTNNGKKQLKNSSKGIEKKLDKVWSELVKIKAGNKCEVCGKTKSLNSHHIYSRSKKSIRWDLDNGVCLCVGHHIGVNFSAHKTPVEFTDWLMENKGREFMQKLRIKSNITSHYDYFDKEMILKELQSKI